MVLPVLPSENKGTKLNEYEEQDEQQQDDGYEASNSEWARLRQSEKARKQAESRVAELERRDVFRSAGIDPDSKGGVSFFVKGYSGEMTPDAVRQAAVEAGFLAAQQQDPAVSQAVAGQQRIAQAGVAGTMDAQGDSQLRQLEEAYQQGGVGAMLAAMQQQGIPLSNG